MITTKSPTDVNQVVEDLSYSTDDSFEIDMAEERKKTSHGNTSSSYSFYNS